MSDFNAVLKEPKEKTPERFKTISALVFPMDEDDEGEGGDEGEEGESEERGGGRVGNGDGNGDGEGDDEGSGDGNGVGVENEEDAPVMDRMEASED